jgi:LysM repeat protein
MNYDFNTRQTSSTPVLNRPTLRYGDKGEYVSLLQTQLKQLMFYNGNIDGVFGNELLESVKAFQTNNKITADGVVGSDTWSALVFLYSPLAACEGNYYIVQSGDSLWSISRKYNTTVDELIRLNNLTSTNLSIGQKLVVPGIGTTPPPSSNVYIVQRGDTLWSIANKFNTTVTEIRNLNNLTSNTLSIGQQLIIPGTGTTPAPTYTIYTVQKGDSLYSIAKKFNTTSGEIKIFNNLSSNLLSIGQQLKIPSS